MRSSAVVRVAQNVFDLLARSTLYLPPTFDLGKVSYLWTKYLTQYV